MAPRRSVVEAGRGHRPPTDAVSCGVGGRRGYGHECARTAARATGRPLPAVKRRGLPQHWPMRRRASPESTDRLQGAAASSSRPPVSCNSNSVAAGTQHSLCSLEDVPHDDARPVDLPWKGEVWPGTTRLWCCLLGRKRRGENGSNRLWRCPLPIHFCLHVSTFCTYGNHPLFQLFDPSSDFPGLGR